MALTIRAERRGAHTKGQLRKLRASGKIPGVVYGTAIGSVPVLLDERMLREALAGRAGSILEMDIPDHGTRHVMVGEVQRDSIAGKWEHVDFRQINMTKEIRVTVRVEFEGEPKGARSGGIRTVVNDQVEVKCMPGDLPNSIPVDVNGVDVGETVLARQLRIPGGVQLLSDPDEVLLVVTAKQKEEETEAAEPEPSAAADAPAGE